MIVVRLESVFVVINRIGCCLQDQPHHIGPKLLESLCRLVTRYRNKVRIIITYVKEVPMNLLSPFAISYFTIGERKKSRKLAHKDKVDDAKVSKIPGSSSISLAED